MEPDPERIKDIGNIKQIQKKIKNKKRIARLAHVEYAKRTFNVLALLTENCNVFGHRYSEYCLFSLFINKSFSLRILSADII